MAQNLTTNIIINAKTGNGFGKVGATLTEMGMIVNGLSQQLINFGEDSVRVYRDYELSMRDAEVALSTTYGRGTQQLQTVMTQLDTSATNWAATTIFHTDDVSNAISEAAHAGWDLDQIMSGIPAAMQLAQAGGLDLSEAVNYIVKSTYAAGIGFEDLGSFIDLWTFAANSSASTIGEFGDAMLRMGGTMRFAANPEELMTLIAVTANAGAVGSEAGTMIRNSIMRLIAPTDKANKAMAQLGATSLETAGLMEDESLAAVNATLAAHGFSVFDSGGNLRNVLDIYSDLYLALGEIAGGYENIDRNQDALAILSAIFPTRTITEALNLVRAASKEYSGIYDAMADGAAEGYGAYASETMMDTLNGNIMTYESKVERLKQLVGEELKPLVEEAAEFGGNIADALAEMDPAAFSALVDGLTVVAAAGPALLTAGAAFRLIGLAMTPVGGAALGLTALAAAAVALKDLSDSRFAENFGNMEMDTAAITQYIGTLSEGFREAYSEVDQFKRAMDEAVTRYQTASSTFSGTLLTDMLTHAQLTDADKEQLMNLGNDMFLAVQEAIVNSTAASMSYWQVLFGGEGTAEYDPAYREIIELTNQAYEDAMGQAEEISQGMREALTSAFTGGESEEEYQQILSYMRSYNDAIARAAAEVQSEEDYVARQKMLRRAQTASMDEIQEIYSGARTARDSLLAEREDQYLTEYYKQEYQWQQAIENGWYIGDELATPERRDRALAAENARYQQERAKIYASYDPFFRDLSMQVIDLFGGEEGPLGEFFKLASTSGATALDINAAWSGLGRQNQQAARFLLEQLGGFYDPDSYGGENPIAGENSAWRDAYALGQLLYGMTSEEAEAYRVPVIPEVDTANLPDMPPVPLPVTPYVEGTDAMSALQDQGVEVSVGADAQELTATIDGADGQTLLEYVTGDAEDLHMTILDEDGQVLMENVTGNPAMLERILNSYQGRTITVNISGRQLFAEGGRATSASIFGEAGPEWAIPEEHSERTAALLNAARAASGFTWPDLLARFGGLNAKPNNNPSTVIYSPVIHANDARGVADALREDKRLLERWWEERKMRDAMEVYT